MSKIVLEGFINIFRIVHLDDITIYLQNWKDHLLHLSLVLERLEMHDLTCALKKCFFARTEVREYVLHYSEITASLAELLRKNSDC